MRSHDNELLEPDAFLLASSFHIRFFQNIPFVFNGLQWSSLPLQSEEPVKRASGVVRSGAAPFS